MDSVLDEIIKKLKEELGSDWVITSKQVFDVVYYFDCEKEGRHYLTGSYGIYAQCDVQGIVSKEIPRIQGQQSHYVK